MIDLGTEIDEIASWQISNLEPSERIFAYNSLVVIEHKLSNLWYMKRMSDYIFDLNKQVKELKKKYQEFWGMNNEQTRDTRT